MRKQLPFTHNISNKQIKKPISIISQLHHGSYYYLKNLSEPQLYLTAKKSENYEKESIFLDKFDQFSYGIHQIWMIQQIVEDKYEIVHAYSTLIMENIKTNKDQNIIKLRYGKSNKNHQLFYVQKSKHDSFQLNLFFIKESKISKNHLCYEENQLKYEQKPYYPMQSNKWYLQLVKDHPLLNKTYVLEYPLSNYVMDVPSGQTKQCTKIMQYHLTKRFNQLWYLEKADMVEVQSNQQKPLVPSDSSTYYIIKSLKTSYVLDIKQQKIKQNTSIIQYPYKHSSNQKWILQHHGKRLYLIRSCADPQYMITVKGSSIKQEVQLVITKNQRQAFWRIIGKNDIQ